jgi:hypothetical protein
MLRLIKYHLVKIYSGRMYKSTLLTLTLHEGELAALPSVKEIMVPVL